MSKPGVYKRKHSQASRVRPRSGSPALRTYREIALRLREQGIVLSVTRVQQLCAAAEDRLYCALEKFAEQFFA